MFRAHRTLAGADLEQLSILTGTESTLSNLTGPGRTLGNWMARSGRRIEGVVGTLATRMGFGPVALVVRMLTPDETWTLCKDHQEIDLTAAGEQYGPAWGLFQSNGMLSPLLQWLSEHGCAPCRQIYSQNITAKKTFGFEVARMLGYVSKPNLSTQALGAAYIAILASFHSTLCRAFLEAGALTTLHCAHQSLLLSSSQEALILRDILADAITCLESQHVCLAFEASPVASGVQHSPGDHGVMNLSEAIALLGTNNVRIPLTVLVQVIVTFRHSEYGHIRELHLHSFPSQSAIRNIWHRHYTTTNHLEHIICDHFLWSLLKWLYDVKDNKPWEVTDGVPSLDWRCAVRDWWTACIEARIEYQGHFEHSKGCLFYYWVYYRRRLNQSFDYVLPFKTARLSDPMLTEGILLFGCAVRLKLFAAFRKPENRETIFAFLTFDGLLERILCGIYVELREEIVDWLRRFIDRLHDSTIIWVCIHLP